jgi:hypothetical protein
MTSMLRISIYISLCAPPTAAASRHRQCPESVKESSPSLTTMQWTFLLAVLLRLVSQVQAKAVFAHFMVLAAKLPGVERPCPLNFSTGRERRVLEPGKMGGRDSHCAGRTHWYVKSAPFVPPSGCLEQNQARCTTLMIGDEQLTLLDRRVRHEHPHGRPQA